MGGDRDHGGVGLVDNRRGILKLQIIHPYTVDSQVGMESDAVGGGALADVCRRQFDGEAALRIQAVASGRNERPWVGVARRDESAQEHRGGVGLGDFPLLEGHKAVQRRAESVLVDGQVVGGPFPRIGAFGDAIRPGHEHLAQVGGGTLVHAVGNDQLVAPIRQAGQARADRDNPRPIVPGRETHFAPRCAYRNHECSCAFTEHETHSL